MLNALVKCSATLLFIQMIFFIYSLYFLWTFSFKTISKTPECFYLRKLRQFLFSNKYTSVLIDLLYVHWSFVRLFPICYYFDCCILSNARKKKCDIGIIYQPWPTWYLNIGNKVAQSQLCLTNIKSVQIIENKRWENKYRSIKILHFCYKNVTKIYHIYLLNLAQKRP